MSNDKSQLNVYCQKRHIHTPMYSSQQCSNGYSVTVTIEDAQYNSLSTHSTKKEAEKDAAHVAVQAIIRNHPTAKDFEEVLKSLEDISLKEPVKKQVSQTLTTGDSASSNGPSPFTSASGRVVNGVYIPTSAVTPPPGFAGGPLRPPTVKRGDIPISIDRPSIDQPSPLNKPSGAVVVAPLTAVPVTPATSKANGPPSLMTVPRPVPRSDKDLKDLEYYCRIHGLPLPVYTIYQERGRHVGRVKVGTMEFGRGWGFDSFDDAKDSAAVVAIAGLAMTRLQVLAQQGTVIPRGGTPAAKQPVSSHQLSSPPTHSSPPPLFTQLSRPPLFTQLSRPPPATQPPLLTYRPPVLQGPPTHSQLITPPPLLTTQPLPISHTPLLTQLAVLPPTSLSHVPHHHTPPTYSISLQTPSDFLQPIPRGSSQPTVPAMAVNYKSILNNYCQKNRYPPPSYECDSPDDVTGYISMVTVNGVAYKSSVHGSKKAADGDAAQVAVGILGLSTEGESKSAPPVTSTVTAVVNSGPAPAASNAFVSYKNLLQEKAQKEKQSTPQYSTERGDGGFLSMVTVYMPNNQSFKVTSTAHPVKKAAEQEAAKLACLQLKMI